MKRVLNIIVCSLFVMQMIGCSAFRASTQPVKFTCEPKEGVDLVVSGKKYNCPVTVELPRNKEFTVEGYKVGYFPYNRTISYHRSDTFVLDVIGTCIFLIPAIGLMSPGARDLDETDIYVKLMPGTIQPTSPNAAPTKP